MLDLLSGINNPNDIKELSIPQLEALAEDIREYLLENVSQTGGHLASNLGIVELTLAIHKVFDTSKDRLVFDVGHQCYVHKILTGRREELKNIRQFGGISGFSRPSESVHDACVSGHASNSVSVSLGMARARTLSSEDYSVIALIGDGAFTGGMAYEGLSDAGQSKEPLIVILNDNEMSITKNVGAMTNYLAKLRLKRKYLRFKDVYRRFMKKTKFGIAVDNCVHGIKKAFKNLFIPSLFFEDMGFTYLGPADGHDIKYLIYLLELARDLKRPVVIHTITKKGKGYEPSELRPQDYHGVGKFDAEKGISSDKKDSFSSVFGEELVSLAEEDKKICAITAAMTSGVGLTDFAGKYPERFFDVAIAEEHAVAMAAGLSSQGMKPVCAIYSTFLQRAYDMLIHDVAISKQNVVFAVDRAGIVGEDGETHHGVFDVAFLSDVPGMKILAPSSFSELRSMLSYSIRESGPFAIRYGKGAEGKYIGNSFGEGKLSGIIRSGTDVGVITYGIFINNVIDACDKAATDGVSCEILKLNSIKPIDRDAIIRIAEKMSSLVVVEDVLRHGSVFEAISSIIAECGICCKVFAINSGDCFTTHGKQDVLYKMLKLDVDGIYETIMEAKEN